MGKKLWILLLAAALAAGAAGWYFLYYVKTPAYTIRLLKNAAAAHDTAAFETHMDLRAVIDRGFDDLMTAGLSESSGDAAQAEEIRQIAGAIKPAVVEQLREYILQAVAAGQWNDGKDDGAGQLYAIAERAGITDFSAGKAQVVSEEGGRARISVETSHPDMEKPFAIEAELARLPDGTWQVRELSNFGDFLTALRAAQKASLRQYIAATKPMVDAANEKRKALTAGDPQITPAFAAQYNGLIEDLEKELAPVPVPHGAKEFANLRLEVYALMKRHMERIARVESGSGTAQDGALIRAEQARLMGMTRQMEIMQKSAEEGP